MQLEGIRNVRCIVTSSANTNQFEFVSLLRTTLCESTANNNTVDVMVLKSGLFNELVGLAHLQTLLQCRDQLYLSSRIDTDCHVMLRAFAALQYVLLRQFNVSVRPSPLDNQYDTITSTSNNVQVASRAVVLIKQIVLNNFMFVDRNTMEALRILPSPRQQYQSQQQQQQRSVLTTTSTTTMLPPPPPPPSQSNEKRRRRNPFIRKPIQVTDV